MDEKIILRESENNIHFMFKNILDLASDSKENIYILDSDRILKYNRSGRFISQIGRIGQGPGEFTSPRKIFIDNFDNLYINDQGRKILMYSENRKFLEVITLKFSIPTSPQESSNFYIDKNGYIYAFVRDYKENEVRKVLIKADRQGNVIQKLKDFFERDIKIKRSKSGGVAGGITHPYSPECFFCPVQNLLICAAENLDYRFFLIDFHGDIRTIFSKSVKSQPIQLSDRKRFNNVTELPSHQPFFSKILSDEKGRIYVIRTKPTLEKHATEKVDIFSNKGRYLYYTELPHLPRVLKNGSYYVIQEDDVGNRIILKVTIRNYHLIKEH